jgi:cyclopropane-fatty-acyl-phospholipid synthase
MSNRAKLENFFRSVPRSFTVEWPDGSAQEFGPNAATFHLRLASEDAYGPFLSLNELNIVEAYVRGKFDIQGRILDFISARPVIRDVHSLGRRVRFLLSFLNPLGTNQRAIARHYDAEGDLQLAFMGKHRVYSHGHFSTGRESLDEAEEAKLAHAFESLSLEPGMRVLDIGGGWGCFTEYAGLRGVHVDSLTISQNSQQYIENLIRQKDLPCRAVQCDFLAYEPDALYDAIVILGVIEHIPQYAYFFEFVNRHLKPGGRVYVDASASPMKYQMASFIRKYIYPGFASCLYLPEFLKHMMDANVIVNAMRVETSDYYWTARRWGENLEAKYREIVDRWGEAAYRTFRMYLWGVCNSFRTNELQAYSVVGIRAPGPAGTVPVFGEVGDSLYAAMEPACSHEAAMTT